jgi:hypothetical protein
MAVGRFHFSLAGRASTAMTTAAGAGLRCPEKDEPQPLEQADSVDRWESNDVALASRKCSLNTPTQYCPTPIPFGKSNGNKRKQFSVP